MKLKLIITISFLLYFTNIFANSNQIPQTDTTLDKLIKIDFSAYTNKIVDTLFGKLPIGIIKSKVGPFGRSDYGDALYIKYPNGVLLLIKVDTFNFMNPRRRRNKLENNWRVDLFKKEKISFVILYNGSECIKGCENER